MLAVAEAIRDSFDQAEVSGTIILEGLELLTTVDLGKTVEGVLGRNITMYADDNYSKAPQILGLTIAPQSQHVVCTLNTAREVDDLLGRALSDKSNRSLRRAT